MRKQNSQLQMTQSCYGRQTDDGELATTVSASILASKPQHRARVRECKPPPKPSAMEMKKEVLELSGRYMGTN